MVGGRDKSGERVGGREKCGEKVGEDTKGEKELRGKETKVEKS